MVRAWASISASSASWAGAIGAVAAHPAEPEALHASAQAARIGAGEVEAGDEGLGLEEELLGALVAAGDLEAVTGAEQGLDRGLEIAGGDPVLGDPLGVEEGAGAVAALQGEGAAAVVPRSAAGLAGAALEALAQHGVGEVEAGGGGDREALAEEELEGGVGVLARAGREPLGAVDLLAEAGGELEGFGDARAGSVAGAREQALDPAAPEGVYVVGQVDDGALAEDEAGAAGEEQAALDPVADELDGEEGVAHGAGGDGAT
jgi:hypothetical protein